MINLFAKNEKLPKYVHISEFINHWLICISGIGIYQLWVRNLK